MTADVILRVRGLRASIAGQQVVEDVTFDVPAHGITALLGRNGVGKTSTLRAIMGLIQRHGEVRLAGEWYGNYRKGAAIRDAYAAIMREVIR